MEDKNIINEDVQQESVEVETESMVSKDQYIRLLAEFDNYKKRTNKEKLTLFNAGVEKTILEILPVVDDFERAFNHNELAEGGKLIYKKLCSVLSTFGIEKIEINDETIFNVDEHEAVAVVGDSNHIKEVMLPGYKLNGKVIRFAKVVVS